MILDLLRKVRESRDETNIGETKREKYQRREDNRLMPLLEILAIDVGGSIAKGLLKRWLGSDNPISDAASSVVDMLKECGVDRRAQQNG